MHTQCLLMGLHAKYGRLELPLVQSDGLEVECIMMSSTSHNPKRREKYDTIMENSTVPLRYLLKKQF